MKKFTYTLLTLSLLLNIVLFFFIGKGLQNYQGVIFFKDKEQNVNQGKSCEQICKENDIDLHINDLDKNIKRNEKAIEIIKNECLWASGESFDVTGDGKAELVLNSGGAGCGSCHYRTVHILDGEKLIFREEGDDISIEKPSLPIAGFKLLKPLRRIDEGLCCPTEYVAETYKYTPPEKEEDIGEVYRDIVAKFDVKKLEGLVNYPFSFYDSRSEVRKEQVATR